MSYIEIQCGDVLSSVIFIIEGELEQLPQRSAIEEHISTFRDQRAAIDIMSWIYKGCYRCAFELNRNI